MCNVERLADILLRAVSVIAIDGCNYMGGYPIICECIYDIVLANLKLIDVLRKKI